MSFTNDLSTSPARFHSQFMGFTKIRQLYYFLTEARDKVSALEAAAPPVGAVLAYAGTAAPTGYLLCDGSSLLRSAYADLFAVLGTTYGAVDGDHFSLPDTRGRFVLGKATSGTGAVLGETGGAIDHTHTGPSHSHSVGSLAAAGEAAHTHGPGSYTVTPNSVNATQLTGLVSVGDDSAAAVTGTSDAGSSHTHALSGSTGSAGTGATSATNPPYLAINYIIRAE